MAMGMPQSLSPRYQIQLGAYILLPGAAVSAIAAAVSAAAAIAAAVLTVIVCAAVPFYYRAVRYIRRGDGIVIERGLVIRKTQLIGRRQVQYIAVRRTLSERMLGLCTLTFVTCAGKVSLPGLRRQDAMRIRSAFVSRTKD